MIKKLIIALAAGLVSALAVTATAAEVKEIPWGTSAVGSSGHRALTHLEQVLNREWTGYEVTTQPAPGAILTVKGYAMGKFEGYYGADVAFYELANNIARFEGFKAQMRRAPVQSFWTFTVEVGVGIHSRDKDKYQRWADLSGERVFTGPLPWDVRAQLERAFSILGVKHEYVEVDLASVGSLLQQGNLQAYIIYTNAEATTAPWITETSLAADWAALNPSAEEAAKLKKAGFSIVDVRPKVFGKDTHTETVKLLPFYYGFHVGLDVSADDVYRMLDVIHKNAAELAKADAGFAQIAADMPAMQARGVASSIDFVEVHPGLARWMRDKGVWNAAWDARVASQ